MQNVISLAYDHTICSNIYMIECHKFQYKHDLDSSELCTAVQQTCLHKVVSLIVQIILMPLQPSLAAFCAEVCLASISPAFEICMKQDSVHLH